MRLDSLHTPATWSSVMPSPLQWEPGVRSAATPPDRSFASLCDWIAAAVPGSAVLDGEIVFIDSTSRPQFYNLMRRRAPQQFVAFDVLSLDGRDLRGLPLVERKRILRSLVPEGGGAVLYSTPVEARGVDLFAEVCAQDLEGIVAKRRDGLYTPDATTWVRIKNPRYSQAVGRRELFERRRAGIQR